MIYKHCAWEMNLVRREFSNETNYKKLEMKFTLEKLKKLQKIN